MTDLPDDEDVLGRKSVTTRRRGQVICKPGFSEAGISSTYSETQMMDQEVPRRAKMYGGLYGAHFKTAEDIDSGVESSLSMLSIADDSNACHPDTNRMSVGLNTGCLPIFEFPEDPGTVAHTTEEEDVENCSQETGESASFLQQAEELLQYFEFDEDRNDDSNSIESCDLATDLCCHGNVSGSCSCCGLDSLPDVDLNSRLSDDLCDDRLQTDAFSRRGKCHAGKPQVVSQKPLIRKEILSLPVPFPATSLLPRQNSPQNCHRENKAFEQSFVSRSELLLTKPVSAFTHYKSPSKYSPRAVLSPSATQKIKVDGESRLCRASQTGHQEDTEEGLVQYLPALDGRFPGSPTKDAAARSTYLSPISLDSRTAGEIWEDVVHKSDRKFGDMPLKRGVFTNSSAQTEECVNLVSSHCEADIRLAAECANENSDPQAVTTLTGRQPKGRVTKELGFRNVTESDMCNKLNCSGPQGVKSRAVTSKKKIGAPHRRLFSELPVSPSNSHVPSHNSATHGPPSGPVTPIQDRKRLKSTDVSSPAGGDANQPKGRAIRKSGLKDSSQSRNGKVRAVRPRKLAAPYEKNQNRSPDSPTSSFEMDISPCTQQTRTIHCQENSSIESIDVTLNIKTSTPVKHHQRIDIKPSVITNVESSKAGNENPNVVKQMSYFSPLNLPTPSGDTCQPGVDSTRENSSRGRRIRPMNLSPAPSHEDRVSSPVTCSVTPPMSSPPGLRLNLETQIELSPPDLDTITKIHTICNGQRLVEYINCSDSPMIITHYPPPKAASKIQWSDELEHEIDSPPPTSPMTSPAPKPILTQRPQSFKFPFSDEAPSPILLTKTRRQNILSKLTQHTPL